MEILLNYLFVLMFVKRNLYFEIIFISNDVDILWNSLNPILWFISYFMIYFISFKSYSKILQKVESFLNSFGEKNQFNKFIWSTDFCRKKMWCTLSRWVSKQIWRHLTLKVQTGGADLHIVALQQGFAMGAGGQPSCSIAHHSCSLFQDFSTYPCITGSTLAEITESRRRLLSPTK